ADKGLCYPPETRRFDIDGGAAPPAASDAAGKGPLEHKGKRSLPSRAITPIFNAVPPISNAAIFIHPSPDPRQSPTKCVANQHGNRFQSYNEDSFT
ncbi:hypothetical protein JTM04_33125, partial [Pseudomonas aeruginosa]|nr:hypothetical protein [Pseudomonas aeruginosa]